MRYKTILLVSVILAFFAIGWLMPETWRTTLLADTYPIDAEWTEVQSLRVEGEFMVGGSPVRVREQSPATQTVWDYIVAEAKALPAGTADTTEIQLGRWSDNFLYATTQETLFVAIDIGWADFDWWLDAIDSIEVQGDWGEDYTAAWVDTVISGYAGDSTFAFIQQSAAADTDTLSFWFYGISLEMQYYNNSAAGKCKWFVDGEETTPAGGFDLSSGAPPPDTGAVYVAASGLEATDHYAKIMVAGQQNKNVAWSQVHQAGGTADTDYWYRIYSNQGAGVNETDWITVLPWATFDGAGHWAATIDRPVGKIRLIVHNGYGVTRGYTCHMMGSN